MSGRDEADLIQDLIELRPRLPDLWLALSPDEGLEYLRCRLRFSQKELAGKSGLSQSRVSLIEGGSDACLSTWRKLYAAMGFELLLVPVTTKDYRELEAFAERGRPPGHWGKSRSRPRRRWLREQSRACKKAESGST